MLEVWFWYVTPLSDLWESHRIGDWHDDAGTSTSVYNFQLTCAVLHGWLWVQGFSHDQLCSHVTISSQHIWHCAFESMLLLILKGESTLEGYQWCNCGRSNSLILQRSPPFWDKLATCDTKCLIYSTSFQTGILNDAPKAVVVFRKTLYKASLLDLIPIISFLCLKTYKIQAHQWRSLQVVQLNLIFHSKTNLLLNARYIEGS